MANFPTNKFLLYRLAEQLFGVNTAQLAEPIVATFSRGLVDTQNRSLLTAQQILNLATLANATSFVGEFAIPEGQDFVHVTGLDLSFVPTKCVPAVMKITGGLTMFASCRLDTLSTDGFTADLSGVTDGSTYVLAFTLAP